MFSSPSNHPVGPASAARWNRAMQRAVSHFCRPLVMHALRTSSISTAENGRAEGWGGRQGGAGTWAAMILTLMFTSFSAIIARGPEIGCIVRWDGLGMENNDKDEESDNEIASYLPGLPSSRSGCRSKSCMRRIEWGPLQLLVGPLEVSSATSEGSHDAAPIDNKSSSKAI